MPVRGPRFKYLAFIANLDENLVYTPATIVRKGEATGLMAQFPEHQHKDMRRKIRHTLARLSANRNFPFQGDGWVEIKGQAPARGWYGWRWKKAVENHWEEEEQRNPSMPADDPPTNIA